MKISLEGTLACAVSPEGKQANMPISTLLSKAHSAQGEHHSAILPAGVKATFSRGPFIIWVHESEPEVYNFRWIANDSAVKYGEQAKYRPVRIALPFVLIIAVFVPGPRGQLTLSRFNECYFRTEALQSCNDELYFPALLNCSKFRQPEGHPLSWICSQNFQHASYEKETDFNSRIRGAFQALYEGMFTTAFNLSSEFHEGTSYYSLSQGVDKRIATIEAWERATAEDDLFVLDVPWLKSGHTLGQIVERIFTNLKAPKVGLDSAEALGRIIFNQQLLSGAFLL